MFGSGCCGFDYQDLCFLVCFVAWMLDGFDVWLWCFVGILLLVGLGCSMYCCLRCVVYFFFCCFAGGLFGV